MKIEFDTASFGRDARGLTDVLSVLYRHREWNLGHHKEVEEIVCRTPSSALKFCQMVNHSYGISREAEKVFLKNPRIGIRYLRIVGRSHLLDEKIQARFWKKIARSPDLAYQWARAFGKRLPEEDEEVFLQSFRLIKEYAFYVIRGPFPEKIHQKIVLRSFEQIDDWEKRFLSEYLRFAESSSKKDTV